MKKKKRDNLYIYIKPSKIALHIICGYINIYEKYNNVFIKLFSDFSLRKEVNDS